MGDLWFLSETVGRVDLHRKYLKAVRLSRNPATPASLQDQQFFASLRSYIATQDRAKISSLCHYCKLRSRETQLEMLGKQDR